jgi:conjugative transfer signal peptidase TraF
MQPQPKRKPFLRSLRPAVAGMILFATGIAAVLVITQTVLGQQHEALRVNTTSSMPVGLYIVNFADTPRRGDMVIACIPASVRLLARARGYVEDGSCAGTTPLVKYVCATSGDDVDLAGGVVRVDGREQRNAQIESTDSHDRPLPRSPFVSRQLTANEFWLCSAAYRSFDSRYFGPVERSDILGVAHLLWGEWAVEKPF